MAESTGSKAKSEPGGAPRDLYRALGIGRDATPEEIHKAYRALARKHHPDARPQDPSAEERFKEIGRAHRILSDARMRALYDEFGEAGLRRGFRPDAARRGTWRVGGNRTRSPRKGAPRPPSSTPDGAASPPTSASADLLGLGADTRVGRWLRGFLGGGEPERGKDLEISLQLDLLEALRGTTRLVSVRREERCVECAGQGCPACVGQGTRDTQARLSVKIPRGVDTGSRIRLAGQGCAGAKGATDGDLIIVTEVDPHPLLRREGRDLTLDLPVTIREATCGAEVNTPTPDGDVSLRIPPGTQSGARLRLRGRGAPDLHGGGSGDLIVRIMVHVPVGSERARALLGDTDELYAESPRERMRL